MQYFMQVNESGFPVAFYNEDINGNNIPGDVIQITESQWSEFVNSPGTRRWDGEKVVEYTPPPPPPTIPESISRRQFFQQLAILELISPADALAAVQTGAIPEPIQAVIDTLPEVDQFSAQMLVAGAQTFERSNPLAVVVREALGWTEEQKDEFWLAASAL